MRKQLILALLCVATTARAVEYELPIEIENEDDLYELLASDEISEETFSQLLDLLHKGVDLATADSEEMYALPGLTLKDVAAIIAYRTAAGGLADPGALVAAGVLTDEKLEIIAPFLLVEKPTVRGSATSARARYRAMVTNGDGRVPAMVLDARVGTLRHLTIGGDIAVTRNSVSDVRFDQARQALSAGPRSTRLQIAKVYAAWSTHKLDLIAGTFHAGFGQRLTLDNTPLYTPNGIYIDSAIYRSTDLVSGCVESSGELATVPCPSDHRPYVSPDYRWTPGFFGLGVQVRDLAAGSGWIELTGFLSRAVHNIYQYEIYNTATCDDPNNDNQLGCKAPPVYVRNTADPLAPTSKFRFSTLPDMWAEALGGGNATFFASRRAHVGVTGWGAQPTWLTDGIDLSFQEWSNYPRGGAYGAVGADATWGRGIYDIGVEATRTFDGIDGGGYGAIARGTATFGHSELELSARWYDVKFVNPHTGAIAEPDEFNGQRARDEAGVRLRYGGKPNRKLALRVLADLWDQPSMSIPKVRTEARGDYTFNRYFIGGLFARYADKDLREGGHAQCYDITFLNTEDGEPVPCKGRKIDLGAVATATPLKRFRASLIGQYRLIDDKRYDGVTLPSQFRRDLAIIGSLNWWFTPNGRARLRVRYDKPDIDGGIADRTFLENTLWGYLQLTYRLPRRFIFSARYEIRDYLNEAMRSYTRTPSPEHWFELTVEARY